MVRKKKPWKNGVNASLRRRLSDALDKNAVCHAQLSYFVSKYAVLAKEFSAAKPVEVGPELEEEIEKHVEQAKEFSAWIQKQAAGVK